VSRLGDPGALVVGFSRGGNYVAEDVAANCLRSLTRRSYNFARYVGIEPTETALRSALHAAGARVRARRLRHVSEFGANANESFSG
jgi:hypothetical protein